MTSSMGDEVGRLDPELLAELRATVDKRKITDLVYAYCKAADRCDTALMKTLYHEDAIDDHGSFSCGPAMNFIARLPEIEAPMEILHHNITTINIRLDGDYAEGEIYLIAMHSGHQDGRRFDLLVGGRYLDRYERRRGVWKFSYRAIVADWAHFSDPSIVTLDHPMIHGARLGQRGPDDPSYAFFRLFHHGEAAQTGAPA